jgi:hypothetical protein
MFMRTKSVQNVCYRIFVLMLCKSKLDVCVSTNLPFSVVLWILYSIILPFILHWSAHRMVSLSIQNVFQRTSGSGSGPDLTLSPTVLVDIHVTRRIAEI